ncbi:MAG: MFS transporter [Dehalococcoidia bacterium]
MASISGAFEAFGVRSYRFLWSGSLIATMTFMMSFMLVPSVAFDISGSNAAAGFAQMGSGVGMLFVAPIGGVIADRMRKKPLVLAGQIVPGLVILCMGILIVSGRITVPLIAAGTLVMGLGFSFMGPARQAWVGELVPKSVLPNAVAMQQIAMNVAQVAAPLLIAVLVGTWVDVGHAYLLMASLFLIVLPLTTMVPNTPPSIDAGRRSVGREFANGVNYVVGRRVLRTLWLSAIGLVICGFAFQTLLPGLLSEELGRKPTDVGVIFFAFAVAGLIVNVPLAAVVRTRFAWPAMLGMGLLMALGFFLMSTAPTYGLVILTGIPLGIGRSGFQLMNNALLMSNSDPAYFGRVMSLAMMAFGAQSLLAPVWGAVADGIGVRPTLSIVGVVAVAVTGAALLAWLPVARATVSPDSTRTTGPPPEVSETEA